MGKIFLVIAVLVAAAGGALLFVPLPAHKPVVMKEPAAAAKADLRKWQKKARNLKTAEDLRRELAALQPAADNGDMVAQYKLGMLYETDGINCLPSDQGVLGTAAADFEAAKGWYKKSADNGYLPALAALGNLYIWGVSALGQQGVDNEQGFALLQEAAAGGSASAMRDIGHMYGQARGGVPFDCAKMLEWHHRGAEHGDFDSMLALARAYGEKICVPQKDPVLGWAWGYLSGVQDEKPENFTAEQRARADAFVAEWRARHPDILLTREAGDAR